MRGLADKQAIERLAALLDSTQPPAGRHGVDEQLASLLTGVQTLRQLQLATDVDAEARAKARRRLVAVAAVRPANGPAAMDEPTPTHAGTPVWRRRGVLVGATGVAAVVAVGAVVVVGNQAQPGSPLDAVKRDTEHARVTAASSEADRGRILLALAGTRLSEATKSDDPAEQAATLRNMTTQWTRGFRLLSTAAVSEHSRAPLNTAVVYLKQQRPPVAKLVNAAPSGSAYAAALSTLQLLNKVQTRVGTLGSTLQCASTARTDTLGPLPGICTPGQSEGAATPGSGSPSTNGGTAPIGGGTSPSAPTTNPPVPTHAPSEPASSSPSTGIGGSVSSSPTSAPSSSPSPTAPPTSSSPSPTSPSPSPSAVSPSTSPAADTGGAAGTVPSPAANSTTDQSSGSASDAS